MDKLMPFSRPIKTKIVDGRKIENKKVVKDSSKKLLSSLLETIVHPQLTELEKIWYKRDKNGQYILKDNKRIKIIPEQLVLTEDIIAIWYFDDGSNNVKTRQATFNTQGFTKEEVQILIDKLKENKIDCGLSKNRNQFVITTHSKSYLDLIELAKSKLPCDCVSYKVDLSGYKSPNYSTRFKKH